MSRSFRALQIEKASDNRFHRAVVSRTLDELDAGDVTIAVEYSSLNYKDALSAIGNPGVTRQFPHTPGIDAAGKVIASNSDAFAVGDAVLVTGYDLGMETDGGFAEIIRVPAGWVVPLPEGLTAREAMIIGTAGFTAALSVQALLDAGVNTQQGEILVTGATGGVGSTAVALLNKAGFTVVAVTGKADKADFLKKLGAAEVISREEFLQNHERPMLKERWAGAVDCVAGNYLAAAIKATKYGGAVTCCGLTASPELAVSIFPFILRGVSLLGIDSVKCPMETRLKIWKKLASEWKLSGLDDLTVEITLDDVSHYVDKILKGEVAGRVLVNLHK